MPHGEPAHYEQRFWLLLTITVVIVGMMAAMAFQLQSQSRALTIINQRLERVIDNQQTILRSLPQEPAPHE